MGEARGVGVSWGGARNSDDADAVVLVVVTEEGDVWIFEGGVRVQESLVESFHGVEVLRGCSEHDVGEGLWSSDGWKKRIGRRLFAVLIDIESKSYSGWHN